MLIAIATLSCKQNQKIINQSGVYQLEKQSYKSEGIDTSITSSKQVKIYTDTHYFYANLAADSSVGFGLGTYELNEGGITEHNVYNSGSLDTTADFQLKITKTEKGYLQSIPEMMIRGKKYELSEEYASISGSYNATSLDGAWKQVKYLKINKQDTTTVAATQFKVYQNGHFLFVHRYPTDSTNSAFKAGFGFGKFTVTNNNLEEVNELSNYPSLIGVKYSIQISLNGKDEYVQTISDSTGTKKTIETYQRMKK